MDGHLQRQEDRHVYLSPGEACWWTIHPASKQRSEGEKVRIGDDLILVSVSSERYLVSKHSVTFIHNSIQDCIRLASLHELD